MSIACPTAHDVISSGLAWLERASADPAAAQLPRAQAQLKQFLLAVAGAEEAGREDSAHGAGGNTKQPRFMGARYALVCWLDELFTTRSAWAHDWNEHKLEVELYGSNDRAWKFWEQARLAETRPTCEALSVYYLCGMLGFRGAAAQQPQPCQEWLATARQKLGQIQEPDWPLSGELPARFAAGPLTGSSSLRRMALASWIAMLLLGPIAAFYFTYRLGQ